MAYSYGGNTYGNFAGAVSAAESSPGGGAITPAAGGSVSNPGIISGGGGTPPPTPEEVVDSPTPQDDTTVNYPEISMDADPAEIAAARAREDAAKAALREQAEAVFNPITRRATETGNAQTSTVKGVTGQRQGFNLSTAETDLIYRQEERVSARLEEINAQKQAYITTGDMAAADRADAQIQQLKDNAFQLSQARANAFYQKRQDERAAEQLDLSIDIFKDGQNRWKQEQKTNKMKWDYDVTRDMKSDTALSISNLVASGTKLDDLTNEQITKLEKDGGFIGGTFEAFYTKALEAQVSGEVINELAIEKLKADIYRVYNPVSTGDSGLSYYQQYMAMKEMNKASSTLMADAANSGSSYAQLYKDNEIDGDSPKGKQRLGVMASYASGTGASLESFLLSLPSLDSNIEIRTDAAGNRIVFEKDWFLSGSDGGDEVTKVANIAPIFGESEPLVAPLTQEEIDALAAETGATETE